MAEPIPAQRHGQALGLSLNPDHVEEVSRMWQKNEFPYADLANLQMVELPYQNSEISMLILLPKLETGLKEIESSLSPKTLREWKSRLVETKVIVCLPKFKMTWSDRLNRALQTLGMADAFDESANFAGMDGNPHGLFIGQVLHKAFIDVKEEGTEAAAATAVMMPRAAAPVEPVFLANHPFLFLIQDDKTGSILFVGRGIDPNATGE